MLAQKLFEADMNITRLANEYQPLKRTIDDSIPMDLVTSSNTSIVTQLNKRQKKNKGVMMRLIHEDLSSYSLIKKPDAPKSPKNAWLYYYVSNVRIFCDLHPYNSPGEIVKIMATEWRSLSDFRKSLYQKQADQYRERYYREMEEWQCSTEIEQDVCYLKRL